MTPRYLSNFSFYQLLQKYPDTFAAAACAILIFLGWLSLHLGWIGLALLIFPIGYVIGGYESTKDGLTTLFKERELDVDLLMIVAALGAAILGLWQQDYYLIIDGGVLILIFAVSGALETIAMERTERNISSLMATAPNTAIVIDEERQQEIAITKLQIGDLVLVRPGELIPVDGIIIEGWTNVNQASITGESIPVDKQVGDEVFAGTLNGNGALKVKVARPPENSLIQRVIRLVEKAQTEAPPSQQFIERFERSYARVIVLVGLLLAILPPFLLSWDWETTIYRALIFLVVASPCALMAAIMPTLLSGIARGARAGILFKNGGQLEKIGKIKAIAFDKTGTLTTGKLEVAEIVSVVGEKSDRVLKLAAALESHSEHPIGKAITQAALQKNFQLQNASQVQAKTGLGIVGEVGGKTVKVGKAAFIRQEMSHLNPEFLRINKRLEKQGKTVVWVVEAEKVIGSIAVADTIRLEAVASIQELKEMGIEQIVLLTGDNQVTANSVAESLGIEMVHAELLPEDKLTVIRQLQRKYQNVAMVGDGINDAPALAMATVGIAMGGAGNDVALETADVILMSDRLEKISQAISLGRRANRIIKQNITFALSFILLLLIANFTGNINMPLGVIGHEGSTVLVTISGLRLLLGSKITTQI
ncbi:heavy metal translocating P-type ATPase [Crocosphaera sp.]|uniref:heavy metal translocating P-type ATPase n=1 Tax=Crocosphaera sp. TaxID=2729996 RepID=UPI002634CFC4|nr:heavy metal translocating P-type ATPase [Crocosphaera sp.]MDJ0578460.1 heavy metal translocating P-type ATPase [Crocosphaera sp.]